MSRRKKFIKAWKIVTETEVEVAVTPEAIHNARQYLAQPQVTKRIAELLEEFLMKQEINGTPLPDFLRGKPVEINQVIYRILADNDFLKEIAPTWLRICHWAAWNQALTEMDIQESPSDHILKTVRPLVADIADAPQHKAACLEKLAAIVAKVGPRLRVKPSEIPEVFLKAFQEKGNQGT
ncbi:hypothetical protein ACFLV0_05210 [Chloroflexota bacterium]